MTDVQLAISLKADELRNLDDLLTPEERTKLNADLAEMSRLRRRAAAEAGQWVLP